LLTGSSAIQAHFFAIQVLRLRAPFLAYRNFGKGRRFLSTRFGFCDSKKVAFFSLATAAALMRRFNG
jgi:hypothetical protein